MIELVRDIINYILQLLGIVIPIIIPKVEESRTRPEKIDAQLKKLRDSMPHIRGLLDDFQTKQITETSVRNWLDDLKEVAYDLDDLFDDIKILTMNQPSAMISDETMMTKIEEISMRWEGIHEREKVVVGKSSSISSHTNRPPVPTTPYFASDEPAVYGREEEKQSVIKMLCDSNNDGAHGISVISIVGMGGIGKTTLAQLVYNDTSVKGKFDVRAWVYVSQEFDVVSIIKSIHEQIIEKTSSSNLLITLQGGLRKGLERKKFLIVLDDVWNKDYKNWDVVRASFPSGVFGSRIIITTRDETVASTVGYRHSTHRLKLLTNEDCLKILTPSQNAPVAMSVKESDDLKNASSRLIEKCNGLPLAAMVVGRYLHHNESTSESALDSRLAAMVLGGNIISNESTKREGTLENVMEECILPVLQSSYYDLPTVLKNLFAYCSLFPKGYKFDKNDLVYLWMGEGFLEKNPHKSKSIEEIGIEYFDELLSRSFFQHVSGSDTKFVIHDHVHALAQSVGGRIYCCLDEKMDATVTQKYEVPKGTRHCSFLRHKYETFQKFVNFSDVRGLRSFIAMPIEPQRWSPSYLSNKILVELVLKMQVLRVLSISGYESITELPDDICKLIHLRYLNLSSTGISTLPDSLGDLVNLETLLIRDCYSLSKLPASLDKLLNLRHLDNSGTIALIDMPIEIGTLSSLQTMPKVVLGKGGCFGLQELGQLRLLSGTLAIHNLQCVPCVEDVRKASIKSKDKLDALVLTWGTSDGNCSSGFSASSVIEELRPHKNLSTLKIASYIGEKFPMWMGDDSYSKLSSISIIGCLDCTSLPSLGCLPELKHLRLENLPNVEDIGNDFFGSTTAPFPKLKVLIFYDLPKWRTLDWNIGGQRCVIHLSNLRELSLTKCGKLMEINVLSFPLLWKLSLEKCGGFLLLDLRNVDNLTFLKLHAVSGLSHFPKQPINSLVVGLEELECIECSELSSLWEEDNIPQHLRRLKISKCPQLKSLTNLPSNLQVLEVDVCEHLEFINSDSKKHEANEISSSLKILQISTATLRSLPANMSKLESLYMPCCFSFSTWSFPKTLKTVRIVGCNQCQLSFIEHKFILNELQHLVTLFLSCLSIEEFPPSNDCVFLHLRTLNVHGCNELKNLACNGRTMKSLQSLNVFSCQGLDNFPSSDLPPNLLDFWIDDCKTLKPLKQWGLDRLSSLLWLTLSNVFEKEIRLGDDDCSFVFPASLVRLDIEGLLQLKSLAKVLENLISLRCLFIYNCPEISILPSECFLINLWHLLISNCRNVKVKGQHLRNNLGIPCFRIVDRSNDDPREFSDVEYWQKLIDYKMEGKYSAIHDFVYSRLREQGQEAWEQAWEQKYRNGIA